MQGIFAESPDRVFLLMRGELPALERPLEVPYPDIRPEPVVPGVCDAFSQRVGGADHEPGQYRLRRLERMARHARRRCALGALPLIVVDRDGNIVEEWTQWDHLFRRPHSVSINPYDP